MPPRKLTEHQIDAVIQRHIGRFGKPGVTSVRPGVRITKGWLTHDPAIVVSVRKKSRNLPPHEMLPDQVEGIPVDVRPMSPMEALRATDPEAFAQELADTPRGATPVELHTANFPMERNLQGELISPQVDKAVARVRPRRPGEPKPDVAVGPTYQKLPAPTFKAVTDNFKITCFASPDAGWPTLKPFLAGIKDQLTVGMYEFTAPHIVQTVSAQMKDKATNLVLDDPDYDTTMREQTNDDTIKQLSKTIGKGLKFAWAAEGADKHNSLHLFPAAYHIKVAVADSKAFFLSSGNFNSTNQPNLDPFGPLTTSQTTELRKSDRDWHVIVEHIGLAKMFEDLILRDLQQALPGKQQAPAPILKGTGNALGKMLTKFFKAQTFEGKMTVQPAITPDNYVDVILPLFQGAENTVWMQTQYIKPSSKFPDDINLPLPQRSILEQLINAIASLIKKKDVDVRIIVDARVTSTMLEHLQIYGGIDGANIRRQHGVHNKGMIFDSKTVVIGSQNWSTEGVDSNRDASVAIQNPKMAVYWAQIFDNDWQTMTLPHEDPVR
jgi:hypothetical protein